jgi:hypothetical protein
MKQIKRKEIQMNTRKTIALLGVLMILGVSFVLAEDTQQKASRNTVQNMVRSRFQVRTLFVDENGDGICDFANDFRDHDNDGIPNGQDSDWTRPKDGTGYMAGNGRRGPSARFGGMSDFSNNQFGTGTCDGTGPKSIGNRRGGR